MRQKAVVMDVQQQIATVKVFRSTMCEGCAKRGEGGSCACGELLGANRVMIAQATNEIGAGIGDAVEIETDSAVVLRYAALVFLLPVAAFFVLYAAADALFAWEYAPWVAGGGGFVLSFLPVIIADRLRRGRAPQLHIVSRLSTDATINESGEKYGE